MMLARFLARQLSQPSGLVGRLVLGRLWNARNAALNDMAFEHLALKPDDRVLEVGFGGGYLLGRMATVLSAGFLAGVDASPAMVAFCEKRHRRLVRQGKLELRCAGAEALPYPSGYFTKACSVNSIFYWQDAAQAMAELWRVVVDEGMLVLCFTCKHSLEDKAFTNYGMTLYQVDAVQGMMESAGFQQVRMISAWDKHREFLCAVGRKARFSN